ncbi:FBP domain-containing protein [Nocardiopsis sp. CNR-923]|nr:FBP domain-containing protein [Nocardiopsis sp. CNR-923]
MPDASSPGGTRTKESLSVAEQVARAQENLGGFLDRLRSRAA